MVRNNGHYYAFLTKVNFNLRIQITLSLAYSDIKFHCLSFTKCLCVTPVMILGWLQDYYSYESYYYFPIPTLELLSVTYVFQPTRTSLCAVCTPTNPRAMLRNACLPTVRGHWLSTPRWCTKGVCARRHVHHVLHVLDKRVVCNQQ